MIILDYLILNKLLRFDKARGRVKIRVRFSGMEYYNYKIRYSYII